jgi:hypothetical protein
MREQVRLCLLRYLDVSWPAAIPRMLIVQYLRGDGFNLDASGVATELGQLREKGLVKQSENKIAREMDLWEITEDGRALYADLANR